VQLKQQDEMAENHAIDVALDWCSTVLGPFEVTADRSRDHGGHRSSILRLDTLAGACYLKVHASRSHWANEVHAYERWVHAFGGSAPRLVAVRDEEPLALVFSELPGQSVEKTRLTLSQERNVWQRAGSALTALHDLATGECFGPCLRDGSCVEQSSGNAVDYVSRSLGQQMERAARLGLVSDDELGTVRTAYDLIPVYEGEHPIPCHRDYCPANWLVSASGMWVGVIDFEFSYWDVCVSDLSRDPDWTWIRRPDLTEAFFDGYGRSLTSTEEQQLLIAHVQYALSAILWGHSHAYFGFEREGRESLAHLASLLR